jgi:hypothetical protein
MGQHKTTGRECYTVGKTVRCGVYPGKVVSRHKTHGGAVAEMLRLNAGDLTVISDATDCQLWRELRRRAREKAAGVVQRTDPP